MRSGIRIVRNYKSHLHRPLADISEDLIETQAVLGSLFCFLAGEAVLTLRRFIDWSLLLPPNFINRIGPVT